MGKIRWNELWASDDKNVLIRVSQGGAILRFSTYEDGAIMTDVKVVAANLDVTELQDATGL